ncbi:ABC transporter permease subunit [Paracoccus denitrificans]|uniref:ABC transporter permease n=1 Tax=Paracoccus denitrificans TaxID=266 RepID=UPI001E5EDD23|nr:ABC transporter permease subunit [Paracoccus denitrificans]UFS67253.1 ABC transporter permease subunit [Paracoccus denitrificans]
MIRNLAFLTGLAAIVLLWSLAARANLPAILPGPLAVAKAFGQLVADPDFWTDTLMPSIGRAMAGLVLAFALGAPLGLAGWRWPVVAALLAPLRLILMGLPAPVLAILCILWFDGGTTTTILTVAALLVPVFQIAMAEGMGAIDLQLDEMARLFRVPQARRWRRITLPALWTALGPALRIAVANAIRVTLLTELLSGAEGLGAAVQRAQSWLQTDRLFALVIVILALIGLAEAALATLTRDRGRP